MGLLYWVVRFAVLDSVRSFAIWEDLVELCQFGKLRKACLGILCSWRRDAADSIVWRHSGNIHPGKDLRYTLDMLEKFYPAAHVRSPSYPQERLD